MFSETRWSRDILLLIGLLIQLVEWSGGVFSLKIATLTIDIVILNGLCFYKKLLLFFSYIRVTKYISFKLLFTILKYLECKKKAKINSYVTFTYCVVL